jgi:hypothetical protein
MHRLFLALLMAGLTFPFAARAQDYFLICQRQVDMFILTHTWKYYGYYAFEEAVVYYHEKNYHGEPACEAMTAVLGPPPPGATNILLHQGEFPSDEAEPFFMYTWLTVTEEFGSFVVLSTASPE